MKKDIHPEYHKDAKVTCACGNNFSVGSTQKELHIEICSMCHPFYTGKQKMLDTSRRVEKFQARLAQKSKVSATRKGKKAKLAAKNKKKKNPARIIVKPAKKEAAKKKPALTQRGKEGK